LLDVVLVALALVLGLVIAMLRRPLSARAGRPGLRRAELLPVGAGLHLVGAQIEGDLAPVVVAAALLTLLWVAAANTHLTGALVIGVGLVLNLAAVCLHQGTPVRPAALAAAGVLDAADAAAGAARAERVELGGGRRLERPSDVAPLLGDVLAVPRAGMVLSFGDLIVLAGLVDATADVARRRRRRWSAERRQSYRDVAETRARVDQLWGTAPSGSPLSGSQCSAKPDVAAPATIDLRSAAATEEPDGAEERTPATQHR
jgi:hypothetical protein